MDKRVFRHVLGQHPTGVCVVTATEPDGTPVGFVVGSFTSASLDPPLVAFFPDKRSGSWSRIRRAGRFCVNILSSDQEGLCRTFASRAYDKYAGVDFRLSELGSPIISGVVGWIDCMIETVVDAGDHYVVLGRVHDLKVENQALPLLFFQGGYGRFAPLSLAAGDPRGVLTHQLRQVDLARGEMERVVAEIPGSRCLAVALVGEELVVTAAAGRTDAGSPATLVGQRLAFIPPLGSVFAAWMDSARVDRWLAHVPDEAARAQQRELLDAVRRRGFYAAQAGGAHNVFISTLSRLAVDPAAVKGEQLSSLIVELQEQSTRPPELTPEEKTGLGILTVPVFGADGDVAMLLALYGFPRPDSAERADQYIARLCAAGRHITNQLAGRTTSPA